jgi:hypothetical protein
MAPEGVGVLQGSLGGDQDESGAIKDVESEVAAAVDPLVVLLGEDGSDEADDAGPVGNIPTTSVRRRISRLRHSWGVSPDLAP